MPEEKEQVTISYERVSNGRRAAAFLLDAFLSLVSGAMLLLLTFYILATAPGMKDIQARREQIQLDSGLYVRDSSDNLITLDDKLSQDEVLTMQEKLEDYDNALTNFYSNKQFFTSDEGKAIYKNLKEECTDSSGNKLFDSNGIAIYADASHEDAYWNFYGTTFDNSLGYLYYSGEYVSLNRSIILIDTFSIIGTLLFPFIIFCYVIPLCNVRNRQTLGMMAVRIALIDANGLSVKWWKLTLRFLFFYAIELWGSLFCFLVPFIVSITMAMLSKSHQTLSDYVCNTYMVSIQDKVIYRNIFEYKLAVNSKPNVTSPSKNELHISND